jgi:hypothetical protein
MLILFLPNLMVLLYLLFNYNIFLLNLYQHNLQLLTYHFTSVFNLQIIEVSM